ncbi:MAG: SDR family oxidoreductase [Christensenellales bacterium]|jgi:NAD(P)-dependent dehydrogenase (short-subunit alcohol dehydrogenase family)
MGFEEKVCVITGGALGIGGCLARGFAAAGAKVAFIDINRAAGIENAGRISGLGGDAFFFHGDVGLEEDLTRFADFVTEKFGGVDILINNACLSRKGLLTGCGYDDFDYVLRVGVLAPYMLTKLFMPRFLPGASVLNISSTRAFMSQRDTESYSAAKGGISALTHAMAASLAGKVRVNAIAPGWIDTGAYQKEGSVSRHSDADKAQHTSGRVGEPEDILRAAMFLCSKENSFINGQCLSVDGGMTKLMIYTDDYGWKYNV